eukprot:scaffold5554_cov130-Isochrysis_galbana.AAC.3
MCGAQSALASTDGGSCESAPSLAFAHARLACTLAKAILSSMTGGRSDQSFGSVKTSTCEKGWGGPWAAV